MDGSLHLLQKPCRLTELIRVVAHLNDAGHPADYQLLAIFAGHAGDHPCLPGPQYCRRPFLSEDDSGQPFLDLGPEVGFVLASNTGLTGADLFTASPGAMSSDDGLVTLAIGTHIID